MPAGGAGADEPLPDLGLFPMPERIDLVIQAHPRNEEHLQALGPHLEAGRHSEALSYLARLDPAEDIEPTLRSYLACVTLFAAGRSRQAFEVGGALWEGQPESRTARYLEAVLHAELGREQQAEAGFRSLTEEDPKAWEPWYALTSLLLLGRRVDQAVAVLEAGLEAAEEATYLRRLDGRLVLLTKGPGWEREYRDEALHFQVRSNTDAKTCRKIAREAERAWKRYQELLGEATIAKDVTIPLFFFSGRASYEAYAADALSADMQHTAGMFSRSLQVILAWNTPSEDELLRTVRHEVLHQYLDARLGQIPTWLNEGLAEYYELVVRDRGKPNLGDPQPENTWRFWGARASYRT